MLKEYFTGDATPLDKEHPVWGLAATIVWLAVILFISVNIQMAVISFQIAREYGQLPLEEFRRLLVDYQFNGTVLPFAIIASTTVCSLLLLIAIKLKRKSNIGSYLGIRTIPLKTAGHWLLVAAGLLIVMVVFAYAFNRPQISESVLAIYSSAQSKLLLCLALIVAAPIFEELLFRGFVQTGISRSRLGPLAAIFISSLIWAVIHTQYDLYDMLVIFVMGLVLGAARLKTDSVLLTIGLHALFNGLSMLEVAIYTSWG